MAFRVLSGDPGTKNFALSVVEYDKGISVLGTEMLSHPFSDLSSRTVAEDLWASTKRIAQLIHTYKPDALYFERFQFRGSGISSIEGINIMLGAITHTAFLHGIPCRLITASTWKNNFNRNCTSLDSLYKEYKMTSKKCAKPIHEFDASLIGVYAIYDLFAQTKKPFEGFNIDSFIDMFYASQKL